MKKFLVIIFISICFLTPSQADNVKDFEIEKMSLGDSLLKYFSEKEILNALSKQPTKGYIYPSKKYRTVRIFSKGNFDNYEQVNIAYKDKDKKYIIEHIMGVNNYITNFSECFTKLKSVESAIDNLESYNSKDKSTYFHSGDPTGKSEITQVAYVLNDGGVILASCADWSDETNINDALRVEIQSKNFKLFIQEIYK